MASDYVQLGTRAPKTKCCSLQQREDRFVKQFQGLEFLFSPLLEEYYNPTHGQAEENNNNQAPNASFQEDKFINPFCTRDELHQFDRLNVWELVDKPFGKMEGIDFDESFALVARLDRRGLVAQPEGFIDPDHQENVTFKGKLCMIKSKLHGLVDVKEIKLHCMSSAEARVRGVICRKFHAQVMWMRKASKIMALIQQKYVVLRTLRQHAYHAPRVLLSPTCAKHVRIRCTLSAEALIEPPAEVPATNVLSTVVIVPHADPSVSVEDYDNPDSADVVPENAILGSESEGKIDASAGDGLTFSQLDDEARDAVL
ncbi:hypothetical protein Tco_0791007 [Tanacetum coccineum]